MGTNSSCQEEWCVKPAEMYCECSKKAYCTSCFSKHMSTPSLTHNAHALTTSDSLTYRSLKYLKSDHSTEVYEGVHNSQSVIIKVQYFTSKSDLNRKQEEAALQRSSKHPHICRCLKSYIDETYTSGFKFVMIMEKAIKDLDQEIQHRSSDFCYWTESELWQHLTSLVEALAFMQSNNQTHRDIKPANILIFPEQVLKLADFGLSIEEENLKNTNLGVVGTLMYLSPKLMMAYDAIQKGKNSTGLVNHNPYKSDIYSLGLTFLFMASLKPPAGLNYNLEATNYLQHKVKRAINEIPYSQDLKSILANMLEVDEESRVDFLELRSLIKRERDSKNAMEVMSFGLSEIKHMENSESQDFCQSIITLADILNDPCLPIPIKSAISKIPDTKSMILSHSVLPNEAAYLKIAMHGTSLVTLDLADCNLGAKGLKIIIETDVSSITNLSLGNNNLGKRGARLLMKNFFRFSQLKVLRLWSNRFTDKGLGYIAETLPADVEELFLADNEISEEGAKVLARHMPLKIRILSLTDNRIGDKGARVVSVALSKSNTITSLYLDNNGIGPIGVKYLVNYLPKSLKSLRIIGNQVPENVRASLEACRFKVAI